MSKVRRASPARSQGSAPTARAPKSRKTRSVGSDASGRLGTLIQEYRESNKGSFVLSPLRRVSVLTDNTDIEEPRRKSWWKKLDEDTREVMEILEDDKALEPNNILEELDIEILSQEKKHYTVDLPESSDSESIHSIVLPQRKLFTEKENQPKPRFSQLVKSDLISKNDKKTNTTGIDTSIGAPTKQLFQNRPNSKPIFPAALLTLSPNKTTGDKTVTTAEPLGRTRNIFGSRQGTKRKNMFADFILSESEDEIPDIQAEVFGFNKYSNKRPPSTQNVRDNSIHPDITTDMELDDWKLLPSSTMVENQLEAMVAQTPKRARLSQLIEDKESGSVTKGTETTKQSEKSNSFISFKSTSFRNKSKIITEEKSQNPNMSISTRNKSKLEKSKASNEERIMDKSRDKKSKSQTSSLKSNDSNSSQLSKSTKNKNKFAANENTAEKPDLLENQTTQSARVSKILEAKGTYDTTKPSENLDTTKLSNKSTSSKNKSKTMTKENSSSLNISASTRNRSKLDKSKSSRPDSESLKISPGNKNQSRLLSPRNNNSQASIVITSKIDSAINENEIDQQDSENEIRQLDLEQNDDDDVDEMNMTLEYDGDDKSEAEEYVVAEQATRQNKINTSDLASNTSQKVDDKQGKKESLQPNISQNNVVANLTIKQKDAQSVHESALKNNNEINKVLTNIENNVESADKENNIQNKSQEVDVNIIEVDEIGKEVSIQEKRSIKNVSCDTKPNNSGLINAKDNKGQKQKTVETEELDEDKNVVEHTIIEDEKNNEENQEPGQIENELNVSQEDEDESRDEVNESAEMQNESQEKQNQSQEEQNESHEEQNDSQEELNESVELQNESQESQEEQSKTQEEENESAEVHNESEEELNESQEEQDKSHEEENEIQEEQNESHEELNESQEEQNKCDEIDDESHEIHEEIQEVQDESEEEHDESQEVQDESEEEHDQSQEVQDESEEEHDESQEVQDKSQEIETEEQQEDDESEAENEIEESNEDQEAIDESDQQNSQEEQLSDIENDDNDVASDQGDNENSDEDAESDHNDNEIPNVSHDTTGRNRKKNESPEVIVRQDGINLENSFSVKGRNTSIRKSKTLIKNFNIRPSLASNRDSIGLSDGTKNSTAEGSGWDSHRTTRKTLRQTFGKDFTPRKSLRALVMEKSAKRQTLATDLTSVTSKFPQANSTELPDDTARHDYGNDYPQESDHEVSRRTRQTTLEMYLQKVKKQNMENRAKMEEVVKNSLLEPQRSTFNAFKVPARPMFPRRPMKTAKSKPKVKTLMSIEELPEEIIQDMKYKPPKRFQPSNASWITKRLYKHLETKLEPKYDYKARIRSEKMVERLYQFVKDLRRVDLASTDAVEVLKHEMARLDIVTTHFEFYEFFHQFMPREVRIKVVPDVVNKIPLPRHGVFAPILGG